MVPVISDYEDEYEYDFYRGEQLEGDGEKMTEPVERERNDLAMSLHLLTWRAGSPPSLFLLKIHTHGKATTRLTSTVWRKK
jgi:hypothetical protein